MIFENIIDAMKEKQLMAIGGVIYISNSTLIGGATARPDNGFGRSLLNNFYVIDVNESDEQFKNVISNILSDALYHEERGIKFASNEDDLIDKQIKRDKKDKTIDKSLYITLDYCYSDILKDMFSITFCDRDGSAWIGKNPNTYTFEKDDVYSLIKKIKDNLQ